MLSDNLFKILYLFFNLPVCEACYPCDAQRRSYSGAHSVYSEVKIAAIPKVLDCFDKRMHYDVACFLYLLMCLEIHIFWNQND